MSTPMKGALIAGTVSLVVGIVANYGIVDTFMNALVCWSPLGALIGWAWGTHYTVNAKPTPPPKDPTRYHPE